MQVLILLAHGSRADAALEAHRHLAASVADATGQIVLPAFLEMAPPDLSSTIDAAVADGTTRITVLPHFLGPGNHVSRDIPALVEAARSRHPGVTIAARRLHRKPARDASDSGRSRALRDIDGFLNRSVRVAKHRPLVSQLPSP